LLLESIIRGIQVYLYSRAKADSRNGIMLLGKAQSQGYL